MIAAERLTKRFGSFTAVDEVSFTVHPGSVVGFLGPNGAGKSTVLRMITALTTPTSGQALVLGKPYRDLNSPGRQVGVMLDASAQHSGRSGREVLRLIGMQLGAPRRRVEEMVELAGLDGQEARRRVGQYSLGMRQRLGLAGALMGEPKVLILDEPANGLDPQGIHWMRGLLRRFADQGGTVLLSSHLLTEVGAIADQIVVIGRGRLLAHEAKENLVATEGTQVTSVDDPRLCAALTRSGLSATAGPAGIRVAASPSKVGQIALEAGVALTGLAAAGSDIEQVFLGLTAGSDRSALEAATSPVGVPA